MRDFASSPYRGNYLNLQGRAAVSLGTGITFGWLGPFDTNELSLFTSLGFWTLMCLLWFGISSLIEIVLSRYVPNWRGLGAWQRFAIIVPLTAPIGASIAVLALDGLDRWKPSWYEAFDLLTQTIVVGAVLEIIAAGILRDAGRGFEGGSAPYTTAPDITGLLDLPIEATASGSHRESLWAGDAVQDGISPPLLERLPPSTRGQVLCLEMEDHYVRVHTTNGSSLVLMRLRDAIVELTGVKGLQVHRSWWVAHASIRSISRTGRTAVIHLTNDLTVPVSQPYVMEVLLLAPAPV